MEKQVKVKGIEFTAELIDTSINVEEEKWMFCIRNNKYHFAEHVGIEKTSYPQENYKIYLIEGCDNALQFDLEEYDLDELCNWLSLECDEIHKMQTKYEIANELRKELTKILHKEGFVNWLVKHLEAK